MSFENVADVYTLSPMQEGMLFHALSEELERGVYVDQISHRIEGASFDVERFQRAWRRLVERHAALRTAFLWDGLDEPLQIVRGAVEMAWNLDDWRRIEEPEVTWSELILEDRARGFALEDAPLARMTLRRVGETSWLWLWSFHHLILDGWSARLLLAELEELYRRDGSGDGGGPAGVEPPFDFKRYIAWLSERDRGAAESFWRAELEGFSKPTRLDAYRAPGGGRKIQPRGPGQESRSLEAHETRALEAFARSQRVTLATVLQGSWALLLSRYARERDVVFGVTSAGRPPELDGILSAVGLFIDTSPRRVRIDPQAAVGDWLRRLQSRQLAARPYEFASMAAIQKWSELPAAEALFDHIVVIENHPEGAGGEERALELSRPDFHEQSNYPLALLLVPGERLEILAIAEEARFPKAFVGRILDHWCRLLGALASRGGDAALA
ncbi:MAG: condensation domain-containing protein, partial [Acidobacteriota bacterium]